MPRVIGIDPGDHLAPAEADHHHGLGAGRLHHLDLGLEVADRAGILVGAPPVMADVLGPDAEDQLASAPGLQRRVGFRHRQPQALPVAFDHDLRAVATVG